MTEMLFVYPIWKKGVEGAKIGVIQKNVLSKGLTCFLNPRKMMRSLRTMMLQKTVRVTQTKVRNRISIS